jgi:hypothetical protein
MKNLEDELRNALRRKQPSEGFAERVIKKAAEEPRGSWFEAFTKRGLSYAVVGAVCLVMVVIGIRYRQAYEEHAQGEEAKAQLMQALRITADKLQFAQLKIQQHGIQSMYRN